MLKQLDVMAVCVVV